MAIKAQVESLLPSGIFLLPQYEAEVQRAVDILPGLVGAAEAEGAKLQQKSAMQQPQCQPSSQQQQQQGSGPAIRPTPSSPADP